MQRILSEKKAETVFWLSLLAIGGFHDYVACALGCLLLVLLIVDGIQNKKWTVSIDPVTVAWGLIVLGYGLTAFWAIDAGMSFIGFVKFLPVLLFLLLLDQHPQERESILSHLPYGVTLATAVSAVLMQISACHGFFSVAERFAGFFQYPNAFALLMLISQLLLLMRKQHGWWDYVCMVLLLGGILYTGSRTVLVLTVLGNVAALFGVGNRRSRLIVAAGLVLLALIGAVLLLAFGTDSVFGRVLTISLSESTFIGRLLYVRDALPLLLKYPFGMGYMGYSYVQQSIQTGVYSSLLFTMI